LKRLSGDVAAAAISFFAGAVCQITIQIIAVRALGLHEYGQYVSAYAAVALAEAVVTARGADVAIGVMGRFWAAGDYGAARHVARRVRADDLRINLMAALGLAVGGFATGPHVGIDAVTLSVLSLVLPAQVGYGTYKSLFTINSRMRLQAGFEVAYAILTLLLQGGGVWLFGLTGMLAGTVASALLKTLGACAITRHMWPPAVPISSDKPPTIPAGWSMHAMARNGFANGLEQLDVLLLNAFAGPAQTAIYKVAKSLASLPARVAGPVWMAFRPRIFSAWLDWDRRALVRSIVVPGAVMLAALLLSIAVMSTVLTDVLRLIYGSELLAAREPTLVLMFGVGAFSACTAWYRVTVLLEQRKWIGTALFGATLLLATVLGVTVGRSSALHMAAATTFSLLIASAACWWYLWRAISADERATSPAVADTGLHRQHSG
jgi:O-antigen/teichoic acid export membrane protein